MFAELVSTFALREATPGPARELFLSGFPVSNDISIRMSETDLQLLMRYARQKGEDAFAELVRRHLNLVFSAALRQVRFPQLAEEVAQCVFTDLARQAERLAPDTILTAWLYQVTRRTAIDVVRREASRQLREQVSVELTAMNATATDWTEVEPLLDEAMHALDDTDRTAVLLRYFENKSFREVGQMLDTTEDAARKRLSRAVERLREFFAKRGVTIGASGLVVAISANAVQTAPVGLAVTISTAAVLAGTTITTTATATVTKAIAMTTLQKSLLTATVAVLAGAGIYEARHAANARAEVQTLQQQQAEQLSRERDAAASKLAALGDENERLKRNTADLLKLRAEAARLRRELDRAEQVAKNKLDTERARPVAEQTPVNPPPVETYSATARAVVPWNQALISGGWKTPSGKMVYVLAVPTRSEDAGVVTITTHVMEVSAQAATELGLDQSNTGDKETKLSAVLTADLCEAIAKAANDTNNVAILNSPRVTVPTGSSAAITSVRNEETPAGEKYAVGPTLTFTPTISADGQSVDLGMIANVKYPSAAGSP
jgi:RNA polymerase sigma factor (sigma-70 family)